MACVREYRGHNDSTVTRRVYAHWLAADHDPVALASLAPTRSPLLVRLCPPLRWKRVETAA